MSCARATYVISVADVAFILTTKSEEDLDERVGLLTSACGDRLANYMGGGPAPPRGCTFLARRANERARTRRGGWEEPTPRTTIRRTTARERERERESMLNENAATATDERRL